MRWIYYFISLLCLLGAASGTLPDPTAPSGGIDTASSIGEASGPGGYVLSFLLVSPTRKIAVINHKKVWEGDFIEDKKIIKISKEGVLLQGPGEEKPLLLKLKAFEKEIKK